METIEIKGLKILNSDQVYNLMVSALEGGSNYWYYIGNKSCTRINDATPEMKGQPFVDRMLTAISRGAVVNILDVESGEKLGRLTTESFEKAEQLMLTNHPSHFADVLKENDDATTGDIFFQLAVMGELTFG